MKKVENRIIFNIKSIINLLNPHNIVSPMENEVERGGRSKRDVLFIWWFGSGWRVEEPFERKWGELGIAFGLQIILWSAIESGKRRRKRLNGVPEKPRQKIDDTCFQSLQICLLSTRHENRYGDWFSGPFIVSSVRTCTKALPALLFMFSFSYTPLFSLSCLAPVVASQSEAAIRKANHAPWSKLSLLLSNTFKPTRTGWRSDASSSKNEFLENDELIQLLEQTQRSSSRLPRSLPDISSGLSGRVFA